MAANINPIYSRKGDVQWPGGYMVTANTTADLTSGTIYLLYTADATEGSYLEYLVLRPTPAVTTTVTVLRLWINNGSTTGTAANNTPFDEVDLPAVTASATAATFGVTRRLEKRLNPGYRLYGTLGTASANGWAPTVFGGPY